METVEGSIGQFLVKAMAFVTIAALIVLIIATALIRLLGSRRTVMGPPRTERPQSTRNLT